MNACKVLKMMSFPVSLLIAFGMFQFAEKMTRLETGGCRSVDQYLVFPLILVGFLLMFDALIGMMEE